MSNELSAQARADLVRLECEEIEKEGTSLDEALDMFSKEIVKRAFTPEQHKILCAILRKLSQHIQWHEEEEDAHPPLVNKIVQVEADFINHRHEQGRTFGAKPEY